MNRLVYLLFFFMCISGVHATPSAAINIFIVLKVTNQDQVFDQLVAKAESLQGYFVRRTDKQLYLKVPVAAVDEIRLLSQTLGILVDYHKKSDYLGELLTQSKNRLSAKESVLKSYFSILERSEDSQGILLIEKEILNLTSQIESLKGKIQLLEHQLKMATLQIDLQFRDRSAPLSNANSPFPWLNTMNLQDLIEDFQR